MQTTKTMRALAPAGATACMGACALALPATALAADVGTFTSAVNEVTSSVNAIALVFGYGLLTLVVALALISIGKEVLPALFARQRVEFREHIKAIIVVLLVVVIAAFLPQIITALSSVAGTGVDLGSLS